MWPVILLMSRLPGGHSKSAGRRPEKLGYQQSTVVVTDHVDDDASHQLSLFRWKLSQHVTARSLKQRERHGKVVVLKHRHVVVDQRQLRPCVHTFPQYCLIS